MSSFNGIGTNGTIFETIKPGEPIAQIASKVNRNFRKAAGGLNDLVIITNDLQVQINNLGSPGSDQTSMWMTFYLTAESFTPDGGTPTQSIPLTLVDTPSSGIWNILTKIVVRQHAVIAPPASAAADGEFLIWVSDPSGALMTTTNVARETWVAQHIETYGVPNDLAAHAIPAGGSPDTFHCFATVTGTGVTSVNQFTGGDIRIALQIDALDLASLP